ncbi:MAG: hypothetical protein ACXWJU_04995 [Hyphomicrobium sp.]|jgi:hypothetical protein
MTLKRQKVVFPTTAKVTAAFVLALATACPAGAVPTPFDVVKGSWVGGGGLNFKDGRSEKLACTAYYTSSGEGEALTTALRCTGPSGKLELRSHLSYAGGKVSGSWEERTYNASGDASGTLTPGNLRLNISGGVAGSMTVAFSAASQTVSITLATSEVPVKAMHFDFKRS